jgi:hypothetical protein
MLNPGAKARVRLVSLGAYICLAALVWSFIAFPVHLFLAHSHDAGGACMACCGHDGERPLEVSTPNGHGHHGHHDPATCSICQSFSLARSAFYLPSSTPVFEHLVASLQGLPDAQVPVLSTVFACGLTRAPPVLA